MPSPSRMKRAKTKSTFVREEKRLPRGVAFFCSSLLLAVKLFRGPYRTDPLTNPSHLRHLASALLGVLLWLSPAAGPPAVHAGEVGISTASAASLAVPSVPVRLGNVLGVSSRTHVARDVGQWLVPLAADAAASENCLSWNRTPPSANGRASGDVLGLTFPYYATAPPVLRV
jgi:hypothetical protein